MGPDRAGRGVRRARGRHPRRYPSRPLRRPVRTEDVLRVTRRCRRCPEVVSTSIGSALLDHPAVAAFHWERGIDLRAVPSWTLGWLDDDHATVESEEPLRVRVTAELDGDSLELVVDETLAVVEIA